MPLTHRWGLPLLTAALALTACGQAAGPAQRVILITCDTLRWDRLGAYGYEGNTSPHLDRFAEGALVFDRAYAAASFTLPALSSLMTGRLPDELAMINNKVLLPAEVETLADVIREAGIPTAAVVSNWVLRKQDGVSEGGIEQGFDHYDDRMDSSEANRSKVKERTAADTTDAALHWLTETLDAGRERFFLWVHYQDPHGPYTPPEVFIQEASSVHRSGQANLRLGLNQIGFGELPNYQALGSERDPAVYRARYDAEIRYFDQELGRLLELIEARDLLPDSLIVFSADHGESLGEHDYWFSHGQTLYDELVHVPLMIRYPEGMVRPEAERVDRYDRQASLVGHLDLPNTILMALGLEAPPNHGTSLVARSLPVDRILPQQLHAPRAPNRWMSLTDGRWRLVQAPEQLMLFDLEEDPGETTNLMAREPERYREMQRRYEELQNALPKLERGAQRRQTTPEDLEELQKLGYMSEEQ